MATLTGSSEQIEAQAKALSDAELGEIAWMNDSPLALKARGEIARRAAAANAVTLRWAKIAGWSGIIAVVLGAIAIVMQLAMSY